MPISCWGARRFWFLCQIIFSIQIQKGMSWRTVNTDYSSIRGLCEHVLGVFWNYEMIPRPKRESRLPSVLSMQQVE